MKTKVSAILSMLFIITYPCIFMYAQNVNEGRFVEILPAFGKFLALGVFLFLVWLAILRKIERAALASDLFLLLLLNYNVVLEFLRKFIPQLLSVVFLPISCVILVGLFILLDRKVKNKTILLQTIALVFGVLVLMNVVTAVPKIIAKMSVPQDVEIEEIVNQKFGDNKPNVYYFLYDEYAGFENIEYYYDYENTELLEFFREEQVNNAVSARNLQSVYTSTLLPDLWNLSYVSVEDEYTTSNLDKAKNAAIIQLFENNGYQINMVNHMGFVPQEGCNVLNDDRGEVEATLADYIIQKSIVFNLENYIQILLEKAGLQQQVGYATRTRTDMELMENAYLYTSSNKPTLTLAYLQCPHQPFVFTADGEIKPDDEYRNDWGTKSGYLDQYQYVTKHLEKVITNIKENDPDALVILQSDHGARYAMWMNQDFGIKDYDPEVETWYMENILNAVYYKGEEIDINGLTGVNTLRKVFNEVLGTDFEMLEDPQGYVVEFQ